MDAPDLPGYRDLRLIGRGGSAEVYAAYQDMLDRQVAVKVMNIHSEGSAFLDRELQALTRLAEHPNISQMLDYGVTPDRRPYLVMPLYRQSLADLIAERGALDLEAVLRMAVKLCGALETLASMGILHRDIKPSNVMLNRYGEVVLCDFGLAQLGKSAEEATGPVIGFTPTYAPPEAINGGVPGPAGDVYSLAATLYCCAAGHPPFKGGSMIEVVNQVISGSPPPLEIGAGNQDFSKLIAQAMSSEPQLRPTALAMGTAMQIMQLQRNLPVTELAYSKAKSNEADSTSWTDAQPRSAPSAAPRSAGVPVSSSSDPSTTVVRAPDASPRPTPKKFVSSPWLVARRLAAPMMALIRLVRGLLTSLYGLLLAGSVMAKPSSTGADVESWLGSVSADRPTVLDQLGNAPLTEGLAQVLNDPGTALPITIAACGQWGSGKSSLMLQLADRLCKNPSSKWQRKWVPVTFDAWRFQGRDALWAGVARAIYSQTCAAMRPAERVRFRIRLERIRRGLPRFVVGATVLVVGAGFVVWSAIVAWLGARSWLTFTGLGAGAVALTVATGYIGAVSEPFERAIARGSVTKKFDEFLGITDSAERDIESLLDAIVAGDDHRCLIVLLDDLDRCQAALITEALAAITEIFGRHEGRRIAFVLGVDLDVITSAIDTSLAELRDRMQRLNARRAGAMSEQFLEKVFQLSVSVDGHRRQRVEQLFWGTAGGSGGARREQSLDFDVVDQIAQLQVRNPSEITQARHDIGIHSVLFDGAEVRALRAAVRARRSSLLSVESDDVRDAEQLVIASLSMTPRAAKRFDNAYRLQLQVANSTPGSELSFDEETLIAIAKWVALRMFFPPVIRLIDRRPGMLGELEEALSADRESAAFHNRVREVAPDMTEEAVADLARLLRVNAPRSELARLPLDSFATTTM